MVVVVGKKIIYLQIEKLNDVQESAMRLGTACRFGRELRAKRRGASRPLPLDIPSDSQTHQEWETYMCAYVARAVCIVMELELSLRFPSHGTSTRSHVPATELQRGLTFPQRNLNSFKFLSRGTSTSHNIIYIFLRISKRT